MDRITKIINHKPGYYYKGDKNTFIPYALSYYCKDNKIIHSSLKAHLKCPNCFNETDRMIYEAKQRIKWFLDGYTIHNLGSSISKLSTEKICNLYFVDIKYFRPWL